MNRREFVKNSMLLGVAGLALPTGRLYAAPDEGYSGNLLVTLQVNGGWDVSSFCDPKVNQPGEPEITHWSNSAEIQTAGNINFAPFAENTSFFNKYFNDMLVINGVDMQTNSHTTGVLHNWSGRNAEGFPSLGAMFSAYHAPSQPLSYINNGGFAQTANLIRYSRLDDVYALRELLQPEANSIDSTKRQADDMARIRAYRNSRLDRLIARTSNLPRRQYNLEAHKNAIAGTTSLANFKNYLPSDSEIFDDEAVNNEVTSNLKRQVQLAMAAFDSGLCSAADLIVHGYDMHQNHDALHEPLYAHLTESIDLFWMIAEEKGFADRITLVIGSDFGRTPVYNSDNGKDHWPIGSVVVMAKSPSWGNRVIGLTDEVQNAYKINPSTLVRDDTNGTIIYPKHVHKALRRHLGLEDSVVDADFKFNDTEHFNFFG